MSKILIIAEHLNGQLNPSTAKCVSCAAKIAGASIDVVVLAADPAPIAAQAAQIAGVARVRTIANAANAHALVNYLMRPEVAAKNSNFISYANGNLASQTLIDKALLGDPTVYPDEATMKRLYTITAKDQKATLVGLGFSRMGQKVVREDSPAVRGMIRKVRHLVEVAKG